MKSFTPNAFFDLSQTQHTLLFPEEEPVWNALKRLGDYLKGRLSEVPPQARLIGVEIMPGAIVGPDVFIGAGTVVEPGAYIKGPAWIGKNCQIRHGAYIRENAIIGDGSVIGNSCEVKNSLIFNKGEIPHFNYVGDSIVGHRGHLGAGAILSNVKLDRGEIAVVLPEPEEGEAPAIGFGASGAAKREETVPTGLRKFGAIIGDHTEVGCNSVLSPGSMLGRDCILYPGTQWRGTLGSGQIVKVRQQQVIVERRASA
jgi:NDP-sugar pyrophosphorylase family protein